MNMLPRSRNLALIASILGLLAVLYGLFYNASHFLDPYASPSLASLVVVGYLLLVLAPLFVRKVKYSIALIALAVIFFGWVFISQSF